MSWGDIGMFRYSLICFVLSIVIIAAVDHNSVKKNSVVSVPTPIEIKPEKPVKSPVVEKQPGDGVMWMNFPKQKSSHNSRYGPVLTDIVEHLPSKYGNKYDDSSLTTTGHETLHGINSELRNNHAAGRNMNGFYCLNDKAAFIENPKVTIGDVAKRVPSSLRFSRYQLYLVQQRQGWDDTPTYLIDEWIAYIGGAEVGVDQIKSGKTQDSSDNRTDNIVGPIEFSYYILAMAKTVEELDPNYVGKEQFKEFVAYNIIRVAKVFRASKGIQSMAWDTNVMIDKFTRSDLKDFAVRWYGQDFVDKYLLLNK